MTNTSDRLKQLMKERGLKQVDILKKSEPFQEETGIIMYKSHLSQYVNGKSSPDQHKLYLLSKTLDVSEAWLMGYEAVKERVEDSDREPEPQQDTIAAHFDKENLTEEEMEEVRQFIEIIKRRER